MAGSQLVFVYGTLKRGGTNHAFMSGQVFRGEARTVKGFRHIHLGGYPGLIPYPQDRDGVAGEVWSVNEACLARLDELEGVNEGLYSRALITLEPPYADKTVFTYIYVSNPTDKPHIDGGAWDESLPGGPVM